MSENEKKNRHCLMSFRMAFVSCSMRTLMVSIAERDQRNLPTAGVELAIRLVRAVESSLSDGTPFPEYEQWLNDIIETIEKGPQS